LDLADLVNVFEQHWKADHASMDSIAASALMDSAVESAERILMNKYGITKVPAMVLEKLIGSEKIDISLLQGRMLRKIQGGFVAVDAIAVVLFKGSFVSARQWMKNNHDAIMRTALGLTHMATGHSSVSIFSVVEKN